MNNIDAIALMLTEDPDVLNELQYPLSRDPKKLGDVEDATLTPGASKVSVTTLTPDERALRTSFPQTFAAFDHIKKELPDVYASPGFSRMWTKLKNEKLKINAVPDEVAATALRRVFSPASLGRGDRVAKVPAQYAKPGAPTYGDAVTRKAAARAQSGR